MAGIIDFTNAMFDSVNTASNIVNDYTTKQAKTSTDYKQLKLKADITDKMNEIRSSSKSEEWPTLINDFFEKTKSDMMNPDSPYYCKNNLQADMFNPILEEARIEVNNKVGQMVWNADRDKALVDYSNMLESAAKTETPENYLKIANQGASDLRSLNYIGEGDLQTQLDNNYVKAYNLAATNYFDNTVDAAIKRGDSEQTVIDMVFKNMPQLTGLDTKGLPKLHDDTQLKQNCEKIFRQNYKAKLADMQQGNANKLSEINQQMHQARTEEEKLTIARQGQMAMNTMTGNMLNENDRNKYAAYFDYEIKGGASGGRSASAALNKLDPKDEALFWYNAIQNANETTVYNAWNNFKDRVLFKYQQATGDENATWVNVEQAYPVLGNFLEEAKKHLPAPLQDVISTAESALEVALGSKDNDEANAVMDAVYDLIYETPLKDLSETGIKDLKGRTVRLINARVGNVLEKKFKKEGYFDNYAGMDTLSNYQEGVFESKEQRMAKAMYERDSNPDLVYTKANGLAVPFALTEGLSRLENDERGELKDLLISQIGVEGVKALIEKQTGKPVEDLDKDFSKIVNASYVSDGVNDVTAQRIYTIDGMDYKFNSPDGKTIVLQKKKNGYKPGTKEAYPWETTKTVSQQKAYDSPKETAKRTEEEVKKIVNKTDWNNTEIPSGGFTYTDDNGKEQKLTYTDPDGEEKVINQAYWKRLRSKEKQRIIMEFMEKNPEAAKKWLDSL